MSTSISTQPSGDQLGGLVSINGEHIQQIPDIPSPQPLKFILGPDGETQFRANALFRYARGAAPDDSTKHFKYVMDKCLESPEKTDQKFYDKLQYANKFIGRRGFRTQPGGAFNYGSDWESYKGVIAHPVEKPQGYLNSADVFNREFTRYKTGNRDLTANYGAGKGLSIKSNVPGPAFTSYKAMGSNAIGSGFYAGFEQPKWAADGVPYIGKMPSF